MANTYKNIVIVPSIGSTTSDPKIIFSGANTTVNTDITLSVNPSTNGTLSIDGDRQLFSVTNSMVGIHFSVNDANGIPNIEITDSGIIRLAQYSGNVQILGGQASTSNTTGELQVTGGVGITGNVYADAVYDSGVEILTYFQGVDNTQNTRIQSIETINTNQNTNITAVNQFAASAFNTANGANGLAAGAYNYANTLLTFATIRVSGQPDVIANVAESTVVFVAGSGMAITTVGTSNTITFASTSTGGSIAIGDQTSNSSIFYPLLSNVTSGTMSTANTSSTKLYYQPSTGILNATTFNSLSDETQKTNIQIISNALEITEHLRGVTFNFKENGILSAGLIAQDVEKYLPQLISIGEHGKSLNYDGVIGVLVEAIKELSQRVKDLEGK